MNEQIEQLAERATEEMDPEAFSEDMNIPPEWYKKFAELIVNECIEVVLSSDPSPKMIAHEPYRTIMNNIVEHFGVEE